jgi:hypothetical protein
MAANDEKLREVLMTLVRHVKTQSLAINALSEELMALEEAVLSSNPSIAASVQSYSRDISSASEPRLSLRELDEILQGLGASASPNPLKIQP